MIDTLIPLLIKLVNSKAGAFWQFLIGALLGWVVSWLSKHVGLNVPADVIASWQSTLMQGCAVITVAVVQYLQTKQVHKAQLAAGVKPDGWIGDKTIAAIQGGNAPAT